jgi:hypothetical protein
MPNITEITDLASPDLDVFARLTDAQLRSRIELEKGIHRLHPHVSRR